MSCGVDVTRGELTCTYHCFHGRRVVTNHEQDGAPGQNPNQRCYSAHLREFWEGGAL